MQNARTIRIMTLKITIFNTLNVSVKKLNSEHDQMQFLQINGTYKKKTNKNTI